MKAITARQVLFVALVASSISCNRPGLDHTAAVDDAFWLSYSKYDMKTPEGAALAYLRSMRESRIHLAYSLETTEYRTHSSFEEYRTEFLKAEWKPVAEFVERLIAESDSSKRLYLNAIIYGLGELEAVELVIVVKEEAGSWKVVSLSWGEMKSIPLE